MQQVASASLSGGCAGNLHNRHNLVVSTGRPKKTPKKNKTKIRQNREDEMLLRCARVLGSLTIGLLLVAAGAMAAEAPKEMKLYVFSSGALNLDKSIIQNGASGKVEIPVGFFLIRHPTGDVLFDCGNNDKIITNPDY